MEMSKVWAIIKKDFRIEVRQKYTIAGIFLFGVTCGYLIYRSFGSDISKQVWNVLLWILLLFAGLNAIVKSFIQERKETYLYYYSLVSAHEVIIAKLIYNFILMILLYVVMVAVFTVLLENPIKDVVLFFTASITGLLGISSIFTFVASAAGGDRGSGTMMSILSLPLVIPIVMLLVKTTSVAMGLMTDTEIYNDVMLLLGIDLLILSAVFIIFPSMWRS